MTSYDFTGDYYVQDTTTHNHTQRNINVSDEISFEAYFYGIGKNRFK